MSGYSLTGTRQRHKTAQPVVAPIGDESLRSVLRSYRTGAARRRRVKPYEVFLNVEMEAIIDQNPRTLAELSLILSPIQVRRYGKEILGELKRVRRRVEVTTQQLRAPDAQNSVGTLNLRADDGDTALRLALRDYRTRTAKAAGVSAFIVFTNKELDQIIEKQPTSMADLGRFAKKSLVAKHGPAIVAIIQSMHETR